MPDIGFSQSLLYALVVAAIGGFVAKKLKLQPVIGYLFSGVVLGSFLASSMKIAELAQIGVILLLFSLGIELSFSKLKRVFKFAFVGAIAQIILVTFFAFLFFLNIGFDRISSGIFSLSLSLSSTAIVVKILGDKGESDSVHGVLMTGWLMVQDLAVIPMVIFLASFAEAGSPWLADSITALLKALYVILVAVLLGRHVAPFLIHKVAGTNSRELMVLSSLAFALGFAYLTSFLGISPSLGAFLAGLVISESLENHAILGEIRPLRDLFVAIFFVTLGFMVKLSVVMANLTLILGIFIFIIFLKVLVNFVVTQALGYRGKTAVSVSLGLSQVGEFSFVILAQSSSLGLISTDQTSIVIASILATLLATPFLFKSIIPVWRKLKVLTSGIPALNKYFIGSEKRQPGENELAGHIVICGYGRVGKWVAKALEIMGTSFVVVDYNQEVVSDLKKRGMPVIYGDPAESEVLEAAGVKKAKAVVLAIPDRVSQEALVGYVQTNAPGVKIISRVHLDEDVERLKMLKIDRIVQPEFEAAIAIIRTILVSMGKPKEEIGQMVKKLRISHS